MTRDRFVIPDRRTAHFGISAAAPAIRGCEAVVGTEMMQPLVFRANWRTYPTAIRKSSEHSDLFLRAVCQCAGAPRGSRASSFPLFSLVHSLSLLLFYFSSFPFLISFTYFLLLSIPSLSTRIVPLRFQARGHRKRPNLGLVCLCLFCVVYFLVKHYGCFFCCIWFSLILRSDSCLPLM